MKPALYLVVLLAVAGVFSAAAGAATPVPAPPVARFLGWTLGGGFVVNSAEVETLPDQQGFVSRRKVTFRGRPMGAHLLLDGHRLVRVTLSTQASGHRDGDRLHGWVVEVCKWMGQTVSQRTPSPLGTPRPGQRWDPVIVTHGRCDALRDSVQLAVREERAQASTFHNTRVEITAEARSEAAP
jgi:hypothetical protein